MSDKNICVKCESDSEDVRNAETEEEKNPASAKEEPSHKRVGGNIKIIAGVGAVAVAAILAILFATHVICFHDYASATCQKPMTCKICGQEGGTTLASCRLTPATCTEPTTCEICGKVNGTALGHSVASWDILTEASCTSEGKRSGHCDRCDEDVVEETPAFTDHLVESWNVTKEATCTSGGSKEGICSLCGEEVKSSIPTSGHVEGSPVTKEEVNTWGTSVWEYVYCENCGQQISMEMVGTKASGHDYDIGEYVDVTGKVVKVSGTSFWLENSEGIQFKCTPPNSGVLEYVRVGKTMDVSGKVVSTSAMSVNLESVTFSDYGR